MASVEGGVQTAAAAAQQGYCLPDTERNKQQKGWRRVIVSALSYPVHGMLALKPAIAVLLYMLYLLSLTINDMFAVCGSGTE
jgi:hypothetical protein